MRGCTVQISAGVEDQRAHGNCTVRAAENVNLGIILCTVRTGRQFESCSVVRAEPPTKVTPYGIQTY